MSASPGECHEEAGILSRRGAVTAEYEDFLTQYLTLASANPYHPVTNKEVGTYLSQQSRDFDFLFSCARLTTCSIVCDLFSIL